MQVSSSLRDARNRARLTQAELAARTGTSQATISAYESGRKTPSVETLGRLLAAMDMRLAIEAGAPPAREPSPAEQARTSRMLEHVLALAAALPTRHDPVLRFPRLPAP